MAEAAAQPPGSRRLAWIGVAIALAAAFLAYRHYGLGELLTLDTLKASRDALEAFRAERPVTAVSVFFVLYVLVVALSIPGAAILTLAAGAVFGFVAGLVIVSFASSIGALLAFLVARHLLHDAVQARFGNRLAPINEGMRRDGALYLLTLRLVPVFPFFLVNLLVALTPIGAARFYWVSQLGMLAGTAVYVNAGTQLAAVGAVSDVLSLPLLASFALLATFPFVAKATAGGLRARRVYAGWARPRRYDRNLVVIGAGAGGLVTAYVAAAARASVTLIEAHRMGGDCLNFGCVPSKALIRSAKAAKQVRRAADFGVHAGEPRVDFAAVMARIRRVVAEIEPNDSVERYTSLGVDVVQGHARITSPWTVAIESPEGTRTLTTRSIVIAAGARPFVPPIPGLDDVGYLTSDTVWNLQALPARLVVLGGGPIGCELAQAFARLGAQVTQVEMAPSILGREDPDVSLRVAEAMRADGVTLLTGHKAVRCERDGDVRRIVVERGGAEHAIAFDALLCAVGRAPRVQGYGLEELGIELSPRGTIQVDPWLRTNYPNIYAVGDVAGPWQFTHAAAHQAWCAAVNALFGRFRSFRADRTPIPWATFTDPEVARVGLSETEALAQGIPYEVTRYDLAELDRAIADGAAEGFVKVLTVPGKGRILGVAIVGEHAAEMLPEFVLAMKQGLSIDRILGTVHAYPTWAEGNRNAAGAWRKARVPQRLMEWVARFNRWERT